MKTFGLAIHIQPSKKYFNTVEEILIRPFFLRNIPKDSHTLITIIPLKWVHKLIDS